MKCSNPQAIALCGMWTVLTWKGITCEILPLVKPVSVVFVHWCDVENVTLWMGKRIFKTSLSMTKTWTLDNSVCVGFLVLLLRFVFNLLKFIKRPYFETFLGIVTIFKLGRGGLFLCPAILGVSNLMYLQCKFCSIVNLFWQNFDIL